MIRTGLFLALAACGLAGGVRADVKMILENAFPVVGTTQKVRLGGEVPGGDIELLVVYRPNSETAKSVVTGRFSPAHRIVWRPEAAGITLLTAKRPDVLDASGKVVKTGDTVCTLRVATCFSSVPVLGIVVMVLAGVLLFGGAAASLVLALRSTPAAY